MFRLPVATLLGIGLIAVAVAQDKPKEKKKAPPRIAINDPAQLKDNPDFAVQGEYEGSFEERKDKEKIGAQVIAQGEGQFTVKFLRHGLPGAGWNKEDTITFSATRQDGKVVIRDDKLREIGMIGDGRIELADKQAKVQAKKTERKSPTLGARPPEGAVVLFGGQDDVAKWERGKLAELSDGTFLTVSQAGDLRSKQAFGSFTAHLEFRLAWMPNSRGQGRSNSGVYVQDRYEVQVLDSFGLKGENNECGGIYTQHKPLVNMCLPPMQWQTYDIDFTAARFEGDKKVQNARLTVRHNGVVIHDNVELPKECPGGRAEGPTPGPFRLQDHGDPVVYRNIWVVEKK